MEFLDLSPVSLMQPVELRLAKRLLKKLVQHHEEVRADAQKPRSEQKGYEAFRAVRKQLDAEVDRLSAQVLGRELGLERYMVIHLRRHDGYESRLQVLEFGVRWEREWGRNDWMWDLAGRKPRKDGTLGSLPSSVGFDRAQIIRRRLDGAWESLIRQGDQGARDASGAE